MSMSWRPNSMEKREDPREDLPRILLYTTWGYLPCFVFSNFVFVIFLVKESILP